MKLRADGCLASAALPGNGTGRRDPGRLRARSLAARGLAAVLFAAFAALLALPLQAQAQTIVPNDWSLIPSGLGPGDNFRLLFLSSTTRNASPSNINTYNTFIQTAAAAGHTAIRAYADQFKVVGCTNARSAKANTETRSTDTDAPIYWLNGSKVAENYTDFYDGSWDDEVNDKNQAGSNGPNTSMDANYPFTGCEHDGTTYSARYLGHSVLVTVGRPNSSASGNGPLSNDDFSGATSTSRPFYGLSPLFAVAVVPTKVRFGSTGYHAIEGGAETTVAVSMYPRPSIPVDIPLTVTNLGSTTDADYQILVNGSQVSPGSLSLTFSPDDSGSGAGGIAQRFTVKALNDLANDHRDSVRFGFGAVPAGTTIEGETDGRAAKTATVWLLEPQTEMMDCTTPDTSAPDLGNLRDSYNPRRLNSKGQIKNSGDCVWFKVPNLANNRSHQFDLTGRWVQGVLSQITSPQIKIYNFGGTPLVQDGSAVEDQVLEADRRFRAPLIRFTPATTGTYYLRASSLGYDVGHFTISYVDIGPGTAPATAAEPLTATLEDTPTNHDGSSAFTFRIAFSADVDITPEDMRDHALTVAGGTVTNATQVDGRSDLWELTIEPARTGAVSILVPLDRACTETGALCTADGQALSTGLGHSVPGPAPVPQGQQALAALAPLAASFVSVPPEHDGSSAFWLELSFDAAVVQGSKQRIRALLGVTGGSEMRMRRKDDRLDHWRIRIEPSSHEAVTVTLSPSPVCGAAGAVYTEDGRTFTTALATRIQGPPGLAVADAEVEEAANATLAFAVTLGRAPSGTVTVDYATSDGTAAAGSDYTATSGTLTFAAGETGKTVSVPVLDDAHAEGSKTLTLTLSNPSGAYLADGTATGTINNTDPIPQAWIARFGRTVADQVLDAVEARMQAPRVPGVEISLAGQRVGGAAAQHGADSEDGAVQIAAGRNLADWLRNENDPERQLSFDSRSATSRDLLTGSSFAMTGGTQDGRQESGLYALWGRGAVTRFDGRDGGLSLDGEVASGMLGADWTRGALMAGLVVSHGLGEGSYRGDSGNGGVTSSLTGLYPWGRYAVSERLSVWGVAGYGEGTLTLTPKAQAPIQTDLDLMMAAAGLRGVLVQAPETEVTRLRLGIEGSRPFRFVSGTTLTPSAEIGVRHDGGDAETGFGVDIGGGLAWSDPKHGFSAELRGRGLLSHEAKGFGERGFSGSLRFDPAPDTERGLKLTMSQTVGAQAADGMDALLSRGTLAGLAANDNGGGGDELAQRRFEMRLGYGLAAFGDRFTGTPEIGFGFSDEQRDYSLGWRLTRADRHRGSFELSLEARRRDMANDEVAPEHAIGFKLTARY